MKTKLFLDITGSLILNFLNLTMAHITEQDFALAAEDLVFHAMHKLNQV